MKARHSASKWLAAAGVAVAITVLFAIQTNNALAQQSMAPPGHFDAKGKAPSKFTIELRNGLKASLPFKVGVLLDSDD